MYGYHKELRPSVGVFPSLHSTYCLLHSGNYSPLVYDNNQSVSFLFLVTLFLFVENRTLKEVKYTDISKMHNSIDNNFDCVHYFNNNDFS